MPEIRLCAPRFDCQPAADANEDNEQVGFEICPRDDRHRHEPKDAEQEPVHGSPPCAVPIHVLEVFFRKGPPDVNDQEDREDEPAEEYGRVARPEVAKRVAKRGHGRDYSREARCAIFQ